MITVNKFHISFQNFSLKIPNLDFPEKGLFFLNGDNGSGKTSFLKAIAGFQTEYTGEIFYQGQNLNLIPQIKRTAFISYLPQHHAILPHITGREFVEEGLYLSGENRLEELIESLSVSYLMDKDCAYLSGGEKQILCFIRNLALKKPIILLDEPEAFLSKSNRALLSKTVSQLDALIIVASHHPELYNPDTMLNFTEHEDYQFTTEIKKQSPS